MLFLVKIIIVLITTAFIPDEHQAMAQFVPPYTSIVIPVTKHTDAAKPLYSVDIMTAYVNMTYLHANFLIDIDAPFIWHDCILQWNIYPGSCPPNTLCTSPVSCEEYQCTDVRTTYSYHNTPPCSPVDNTSTLPGWGFCTCPVNVVDPVTRLCAKALLNYDDFTVNTSNGKNVINGFYGANPNAACAPSSSFQSFPANVNGVMAFSTSPYAFPAYLYQPLKKTLALCLPSTLSGRGVLFFGKGPYYLSPYSDDIRSLLTYTPLIKRQDSFGYFIGVRQITIKWRSINIPLDATTKLSTIDPYTILRTDVYDSVVNAFSWATIGYLHAKPVNPFGLCFRSLGGVAYKFPDIDLVLLEGKKWSVSSANSMKQITKDVACLAFVDGGATTEHAIVIGTFQMEDNFVEFDLENSSFGFSSSLLRRQTSCANFNFTSINIS